MSAVGYTLRPIEVLYEITVKTEWYPEGLDEIRIQDVDERILQILKKRYISNDYSQSYNVETKSGFYRNHFSRIPRRYTIEGWTEKRVYSYGPHPSKQKKDHSLFKEMVYIIAKYLAGGK